MNPTPNPAAPLAAPPARPAASAGRPSTMQPEYGDHHTARALFGLSRTHLYRLAAEGSIRTVSVCRPGATKGRRLFDCASIRALLQSSAKPDAPTPA